MARQSHMHRSQESRGPCQYPLSPFQNARKSLGETGKKDKEKHSPLPPPTNLITCPCRPLPPRHPPPTLSTAPPFLLAIGPRGTGPRLRRLPDVGGGQHGELASSPRPHQDLVADGRVLDHCRRRHVVVSAKASLVVGAEAPTPRLAISINGDGVIGSGGSAGGADNIWNVGRPDQDARHTFGVFDNVVLRKGRRVTAGLRAIEAAPNEAAAGCGDGDRVVGTTCNLSDCVVVR